MERVAFVVIYDSRIEYSIIDILDTGITYRISSGSDPFDAPSPNAEPAGREEVVGAKIFDLLEGWGVDRFTITRRS